MEQRRGLQLTELEILKEFQRVCQANGLTFYITAGTLLGAVRHGGFIPWDDDIDVVMPRSDFDRMARHGPHSLTEGYFFQDRNTDPEYPWLFAKLRRKGTHVEEPGLRCVRMHKGIYIDIFPLDACPKGERGGRLYFKWVEQLQCAIMARVNPEFACGYSKLYMRALHKLLCAVPIRGVDGLWNMTRKGLRLLCRDGKLSTACAAHGFPRETYEPEWFASAVEMKFEGLTFPAPVGWRELLSNMYGDYMTLPPIEERNGHFTE